MAAPHRWMTAATARSWRFAWQARRPDDGQRAADDTAAGKMLGWCPFPLRCPWGGFFAVRAGCGVGWADRAARGCRRSEGGKRPQTLAGRAADSERPGAGPRAIAVSRSRDGLEIGRRARRTRPRWRWLPHSTPWGIRLWRQSAGMWLCDSVVGPRRWLWAARRGESGAISQRLWPAVGT